MIKVAFSGVCGTDMHIFHGMMDKRVPTPMTIGHEMSGTISKIAEGVNGYDIGDKVVVRPLDNRAEKDSDKGYSHICKDLKFIGIDSPFKISRTSRTFGCWVSRCENVRLD